MMGVKDVERVMMVQFHQSYSYEDFIMGFRPSTDGFELKRGAFITSVRRLKSMETMITSLSLMKSTGVT